MTVIGTWRANADDDSMLVSVATSVSSGRPQNICTIVFEDWLTWRQRRPHPAGRIAARPGSRRRSLTWINDADACGGH
jgi:hypothetical protein